jgi:hypothetical protein
MVASGMRGPIPIPRSIKKRLAISTAVGAELENLVVKRAPFKVDPKDVDRTQLIVGYWSLVFDYQKSILALIENQFYGGAFALLRPMVEATLRAHVAISCRPGVVQSLLNDKYKMNYKEIGPHLDAKFGFGGFFERLLKRAEKTLHSFTHSGAAQINRRFAGGDVTPHFRAAELTEAISGATAMVFMVTALTTRHFKLDEEWHAANEIYRHKAQHLTGRRQKPAKAQAQVA